MTDPKRVAVAFRRSAFGILSFIPFLLLMHGGAVAQDYRGEALSAVEPAVQVEFSRLRFLTLAFGREGPTDRPLSSPPVMGREYFVEADLFGIESVADIRFELLDADSRPLTRLTMWKAADSSADGEFYGFVTAPDQPFRAAIIGTTHTGAAFRFVLDTLFRPAASGAADAMILPAEIPADQMDRIQGLVNVYRQQLRARAARAAADHPGGVIVLPRAVVSPIAYEPLVLADGSIAIGMRLRYSIRFSSAQTVRAMPQVFPLYSEPAWRGRATMKPLEGTITPEPQMVGVESLRDVIVYEAAASYQAETTYTFTVDMVPDFVFQGTETGRFCVHEQKFANRAMWRDLIASQTPIPYSVTIRDTGTVANIPAFLPLGTFYAGFQAGGAFDCGPEPNIRF